MLPPEKVKGFLAHPDADVRDAVAYYFEYHHNRSIISADDIWGAIDQIGVEKSERLIGSLVNFRQSDQSIQRLIDLVRASPNERLEQYLGIVEDLDSAVIAKHHDALLCNAKVHGRLAKTMQWRIGLLKISGEQLWNDLLQHCRTMPEEWSPVNWKKTIHLIDAIVYQNDDTWQKALAVLKAPREDSWAEIFSITLLGRMKRLELLDVVLDRMELYDDFQAEQITQALTNLDNPKVVEKLAGCISITDNDFRFSATEILARYPTRQSQLTLMRWVDEEEDLSQKTCLYWPMARHMPTEDDALEKLRAGSILCRDAPHPIDHLERTMLTLSKILGKEFPEADEWQKIADGRKNSRAKQMLDSRAEWEDNYPNEFDAPSEKIGRNEPCPCGSGKKYKKCCLGKARIA